MNTQVVVALAIVAVIATSTIATPVLPVFDLDLLPPEMACLYICNICYDGHAEEMMACVNDVCTKPGCNMLDFMKLGRECNNYNMVQIIEKKHPIKKD